MSIAMGYLATLALLMAWFHGLPVDDDWRPGADDNDIYKG